MVSFQNNKVYTTDISPDEDFWDNALKKTADEASVHQTLHWAEAKEYIDGAKPIFLEAKRESEIIAILLLFHRIPFNRNLRTPKKTIKDFAMGRWNGWLEWSFGPVIFNGDLRCEAVESTLQWIDNYAKINKISYIRSDGLARTSVFRLDKPIADIFSRHGYQADKWATYLLDLHPTEDELWKNLRKNRRRDVLLAKKMGATFHPITTWEEFEKLYYLPFCETEKYYGRNYDSLQTWQYLWNVSSKEYYKYYVVLSQAGQTLSLMGTYTFNNITSEMAVRITPFALKNKIPAQDLIQWETMMEAKRQGSYLFDFAGISPNPNSDKEKGIKNFKEKWGGIYTEYFTFQKRIPSFSSFVYKLSKNIFKIFS